MKYKGVLLDLDDTLYPYEQSHQQGLECLIRLSVKKLNQSEETIRKTWDESRKKIKFHLHGSAASHNRLLYIQSFLEKLNAFSSELAIELYEEYWGKFLNSIQLFDGVLDFLKALKEKKIATCLVTDLTSHIQYRKITKLGLTPYLDFIVTSEEAGHEKPHPFIFDYALDKLKLSSKQVCMIGDSQKKDIEGAKNLGIDAYWFTQTEGTSEGTFSSFSLIEKKLLV